MKILVACEESQAVTLAFRARGHEAFSCDVQRPSGGHPEWHIQGDVKLVLDDRWDMIIAHPPCTYLTRAGSCNLFYGIAGEIKNIDRWESVQRAKEFFMLFYNHPCPRICIENPVPFARAQLPPWNQVIQPYEFGENFSKQTCLWLKGLPTLLPLCDCRGLRGKFPSWTKVHRTAKQRSKTFPKIAQAMAQQWG